MVDETVNASVESHEKPCLLIYHQRQCQRLRWIKDLVREDRLPDLRAPIPEVLQDHLSIRILSICNQDKYRMSKSFQYGLQDLRTYESGRCDKKQTLVVWYRIEANDLYMGQFREFLKFAVKAKTVCKLSLLGICTSQGIKI